MQRSVVAVSLLAIVGSAGLLEGSSLPGHPAPSAAQPKTVVRKAAAADAACASAATPVRAVESKGFGKKAAPMQQAAAAGARTLAAHAPTAARAQRTGCGAASGGAAATSTQGQDLTATTGSTAELPAGVGAWPAFQAQRASRGVPVFTAFAAGALAYVDLMSGRGGMPAAGLARGRSSMTPLGPGGALRVGAGLAGGQSREEAAGSSAKPGDDSGNGDDFHLFAGQESAQQEAAENESSEQESAEHGEVKGAVGKSGGQEIEGSEEEVPGTPSTTVPEPITMSLVGSGLAMLGLVRRRRGRERGSGD